MKRIRFLSVFLTLCLLLTACGAGAPTKADNAESDYLYRADVEEAPMETMAAAELKTDSASGITETVQTDRKLIKTVELNAETEHYDDLLPALEDKITALGGYTESRRTGKRGSDRRWCSMTIRIPADRLGQFLTHMQEQANVLSTAEDTQDVTLQYSDTEARITALRTEQTRLLELLSQAQNLGEILEIEARLSDVTYELERHEAHKRTYDNQISYATIHLSLTEVETLTPVEEPSVWQRITGGFADSLEGVGEDLVDTFVWLIVSLPYLLIWVPLAALALVLLRKFRRKKQKAKHPEATNDP